MPHKSHWGVHLSPWQCTSSHACHAKATGAQCTLSHGCHAKVTGRAAETKGCQGVHPTPCRAPSAAPATQKPPAERGEGTPGRTSDPLQSTKCRTCHAKATGRAAETKGRQGVHPTPWQCTKSHACHATAAGRAAETKGCQGVHPTPCRAGYGSPCARGPAVGARGMGSRLRGPWGARRAREARAHEARRAREAREPEFEII